MPAQSSRPASGTDSVADVVPSWRVVVGVFVAVLGYLFALFGIVLYAWGDVDDILGLPTLGIPVLGVIALAVGIALIWTERA